MLFLCCKVGADNVKFINGASKFVDLIEKEKTYIVREMLFM